MHEACLLMWVVILNSCATLRKHVAVNMRFVCVHEDAENILLKNAIKFETKHGVDKMVPMSS